MVGLRSQIFIVEQMESFYHVQVFRVKKTYDQTICGNFRDPAQIIRRRFLRLFTVSVIGDRLNPPEWQIYH